MTLPVVVEIVIGTAYTYLFFSLLASALNEVWARWTNARAKTLERAIPHLLGTPDDFAKPSEKPPANLLAESLSAHPLIQGIATDYRFPSYIPPAHFALALIDLTVDLRSPAGVLTASPAEVIRGTGEKLEGRQRQIVESLISGESNPRSIQARIEQWFKDCGDRVSGAYKRATYRSLCVIGLAISFAFGLDAVRLVQGLYTDPATRAIVVNAAKSATPNSALQAPPIPIGWENRSPYFILGCVISALAITLGAPFWFDLLNLFINPRQTG
jgi:hypothetical protein